MGRDNSLFHCEIGVVNRGGWFKNTSLPKQEQGQGSFDPKAFPPVSPFDSRG